VGNIKTTYGVCAVVRCKGGVGFPYPEGGVTSYAHRKIDEKIHLGLYGAVLRGKKGPEQGEKVRKGEVNTGIISSSSLSFPDVQERTARGATIGRRKGNGKIVRKKENFGLPCKTMGSGPPFFVRVSKGGANSWVQKELSKQKTQQ